MATGRIGVTPVLRTRWSDQPTAGTTSLSGLDDNSVALVYDAGYEAVYRNGVLLSRGNDYTATDGTSITLIDATLAGDIIEVFANDLVPLTDAISKGQYNAKGALLSASAASTPGVLAVGSNNQVLTADSTTSTGLKWANSGTTLIKTATFSSVANTGTTFDSVFSSTYNSYLVTLDKLWAGTAGDDLQFQALYSGTTQAAGYYGAALYAPYGGGAVVNTGSSNAAQLTLCRTTGNSANAGGGYFYYFTTGMVILQGAYSEMQDDNGPTTFGGGANVARTYTGFLLKTSSTNISGTVSVYGLAKS